MNGETIKLFARGLAVWLVIVFAESVHGALRIIILQPLVGDFRARQIAVFTGILIILTISCLFAGWLRARNNFQLLSVGLMWVLLTVIFEVSLGRAMDLSWERILSDYDVAHGGLMAFGLIFLALAPLIAAKLRNKTQTDQSKSQII